MRASLQPLLGSARRLIIWCLLAAVPLCGLSTTLAQVVGPNHVHRSAASAVDSMAGWNDFRRTQQVTTVLPKPHSHSIFERHQHERDDASVVALDHAAGDATGSAETSTSACAGALSFALASASPWFTLDAPKGEWSARVQVNLSGRETPPLERPPKA